MSLLKDEFVRIVSAKNVLSIDDDNVFRLHQTSETTIFEITKSKIETFMPNQGKPNFTVLEKNYSFDDLGFATALIPLTNIEIFFKKIIGHPHYGTDQSYKLGVGDMIVYTGINYDTVVLDEGNTANLNKHFVIRVFPIGEKSQRNFGKNKYKASIIFSDKYEIELSADNEKDAREHALKIPFSEWDHIFNTNKDKPENYKATSLRYSMWIPSDIIIENGEGNND